MIYIIAVHMSTTAGHAHEHIDSVQWMQPGVLGSKQSTRQQVVDWINQGGDARVRDQSGDVHVGVWNASPPYLRTFADDRWTDNLLILPRY